MKKIFEESYDKYINHMSSMVENYMEHTGHETRRRQCDDLVNVFDNIEFPFDELITVETGVSRGYDDGLVGLFLGFATEKTNGKMFAVDINEDRIQESSELFFNIIPQLQYQLVQSDSIKFLSNLPVVPNLVHLDSWDLDLKNPLPCALHGWKEFIAIEGKMPSGSIILIDDNYLKGTWVDWIYPNGESEKITIDYPIIGKGSHVYQHVLSGNSDWELIGNHYKVGTNIKIILQKK